MSASAPTTAEAKGGNIAVPFLAIVTRVDPDFARARHRQVEYEFSNGREFLADPNTRGAFNVHIAFQSAFQPTAFQLS